MRSSRTSGLPVVALIAGLAACGPFASGCREAAAPPRLYQDLGTDGRMLLPTNSVWLDAGVRPGRAEWHPFKDPSEFARAATSQPVAPAAPGAAAGQGDVEQRIRAVLADYHRFLDEGQYGELATFFIESQADAVDRLVQVLPAFFAKLKELNAALEPPDPALAAVLDRASVATAMRIEVGAIEVIGPAEAKGSLVPAGEVRFTLADDGYWYIDLPALAAVESIIPTLAQGSETIDALIAKLKSGEVASAEVAAQLAPLAQVAAQMAGGNAAQPASPQDRTGGAPDSTTPDGG